MYYSFKDMILVHWFLGLGLAIISSVLASKTGRPRFLYTFGNDPFSFGTKNQWWKWYIFSYAFEALTSLFYFTAGYVYLELAYSIWQALCMTVGGFLVDRAIVIFTAEAENPPVILTDSIQSLKAKFTPKPKPAPTQETVIILPDRTKEETEKFDSLIKGH